MKDGPCPKCQHAEHYRVHEALVADRDNDVSPLTLTAHHGAFGKMGWAGDKRELKQVRISAYICGSCGFTETYALDLEVLALFAGKAIGNVTRERAP